ncbi:thioesterase-like superfamily-domain-containing protein [Annulohypoxylon maeteangense]|uniref:thioesterase-like superfamily-domain-containing protein n=1 Tax=Annulohypoxylon maeteangense TaxID=1927788 RepID=UPI002007F186|nr:thioesterase-like superfamily-domain-containing protein [Annulohypoxylon maeteangense]KAI0883006.1 thioesterase-like superfamily-domain-containing protein [Annulohypoxylon maeteangense]
MAPTFAEATAITALDSHTYSSNLNTEWCVGSVPHGGVVTSVFLRVATTHFRTTLATQNQPHTVSLHLEFLRRTQEGPATLVVRDVKLGRQTSTIHVVLSQDGRDEVVGYLTHSNIDTETGLSLKTPWSLEPPPPPSPANFAELLTGGNDPNWIEQTDKPFPKFRKISQRVRTVLPRKGQVISGLIDEWLRLDSGERFTNESVGLVCDHFPSVLEDLWRKAEGNKPFPPFWYPTVVLNLDIKKVLPPEGVEWLFVRVRTKSVKNGRMDLEVVISDEAGEVVALSNHVALVVGSERNLAARRNDQAKI